MGYFNGKSDLYDEYLVAANEMRGTFKFMHSFDPEVAKSFDVPQESVVVYIPEIFWTPYENKTQVLTKKSATYKEIITFIRFVYITKHFLNIIMHVSRTPGIY